MYCEKCSSCRYYHVMFILVCSSIINQIRPPLFFSNHEHGLGYVIYSDTMTLDFRYNL
jgi:hypothetical protein